MEGSPWRLLGGARDGGSPLQLAGGAAGHSPLSLAPGVSWCQLFYFRLLAPPLGDSQPAWEPITAGTGTLAPGLPSSPCGHPGPGEGRTPRFPPHDPVRAPGSYPTETLIVTKPWRQPNVRPGLSAARGMDWKVLCRARSHSCQQETEPQPESCQDYGHSTEAASAKGKGPVGLVQGCRGTRDSTTGGQVWTLGARRVGSSPSLVLSLQGGLGQSRRPSKPSSSPSVKTRIAYDHDGE